MNNIPKISIIIPAYNAEMDIKKCIDSILNQTFKDFELIIVNDGSNDNTLNICNEYKKNDQRIRVINKDNGGVSSARNIGIGESTGEYIMFCDSDDWIDSELLYKLYCKTKENHMCDIVYSGVYKDVYDKNDNKVKTITVGVSDELYLEKKYLAKELKYIFETIPGPFLAPWAKLYKLEIIKRYNLYFDKNMVCYEDFDFNIKFLSKCNYICITKLIGYHHKLIQDENNIVRRKKNNLVYDISRIHREFETFLTTINNEKLLREYITSWYIEQYKVVFQKILNEHKRISKKERNEILKCLCNDEEFCKLIHENKNSIRLYRYIKFLVDIKLYGLAYFLIKIKIPLY